MQAGLTYYLYFFVVQTSQNSRNMKRFIILVSCISTFTEFVDGFSLNTNQKITLDFLSQKRRISSSSSSVLLASDDDNHNNEQPDDCEMNNNVSIEYCTGCKWMLRSTWFAQELLSTFDDDKNLYSVTLIPRCVHFISSVLY